MTQVLNRMLPIYALRERRAKRLAYEKRQVYQSARLALSDALVQQTTLKDESKKTMSQVLNAAQLSVSDAVWQIEQSNDLMQQSDQVKQSLPALEDEEHHALGVLNETNCQYVQKARKKDAVMRASLKIDVWVSGRLEVCREQAIEDDLSQVRAHRQAKLGEAR
jgi:hypothetical protein